MNNSGPPVERTGRKIPAPSAAFKKILLSLTDGDITYDDAQSDLQRLLAAGASPADLLEVMRRSEMIEALPHYAHDELLNVLNESIRQAAETGSNDDAAHLDATPQAPTSAARSEPAVSGAGQFTAPRPDLEIAIDEAAEQIQLQIEKIRALEANLARQKADYASLNNTYERARDAGSVASARALAVTAELAAVRRTLEAEQGKYRELDKTLVAAVASNEEERARLEDARRAAEHHQSEARVTRDALVARDSALEELRAALSERDASLASLRNEASSRRAAPDPHTAVVAALEAQLSGERARVLALGAELADARGRLDAEQGRTQAARKELQEKANSARSERTRADEVLRKQAADVAALQSRIEALTESLVAAQSAVSVEQGKCRDVERKLAERVAAEKSIQSQLHATQREHLQVVAVLKERVQVLESQLREARTRPSVAPTAGVEAPPESPVAPPIAVAPLPATQPGPEVGSEFDRGAAELGADWRAGTPSWEPTQLADSGVAGASASPPRGASRRRLVALAAVVVVGIVVWLMRHSPAPVSAPAVAVVQGPVAGAVIHDCPTCPALTVVPKGRFKQGSPRDSGAAPFESPVHWVSINYSFAISTNAVTVDEFRAFVTATNRDMRGCETYDTKWRLKPESSWINPGFEQIGSHPVTCVSWNDAKAYVQWLSKTTRHAYRLPSASEWEYAARGGSDAVRPWSSDGATACASANVADQHAARKFPGWQAFPCDDGYVYTAPVGSFKANAFGLNDMLGNVFQWTEDCWHPDYTDASVDGSPRTYGDCTQRELRGGSWFTTPNLVRVSYRNHFGVDYRTSTLGIRVVRSVAS